MKVDPRTAAQVAGSLLIVGICSFVITATYAADRILDRLQGSRP